MTTKKKEVAETAEEPTQEAKKQDKRYCIAALPAPGRLRIRTGAMAEPTGKFLFTGDVVEVDEEQAGFARLVDGRGWFSLEYADKV